MPLRLAEIVVPEASADEAEALLEEKGMPFVARSPLAHGLVKLDTVCHKQETEDVLDALEDRFGRDEGFRVVLVAVEATLPRPTTREVEAEANGEDPDEAAAGRARVYREEVYNELGAASQWTAVYATNVGLSTVVAAAGLIKSSTAVIIGAMVIAPLLGPNMALALGTTLGDRPLIARAIKTALGGLAIGLSLSIAIGLVFQPDLTVHEIATRTDVDLADIVLALASGAAGALAFTSGAPAAIIGVMVAVALMPPLVVLGLTLAAMDPDLAWSAAVLLFGNIVCVNLAANVVFRVQGLTPRNFFKGAQARRYTWIANGVWTTLLLAAVAWIIYSKLW